jgi:hypothetical protein
MSGIGNAIKLDSQSFTLFQKELHRRRGKFENGKPVLVEGVSTIFQHRFRKISWYTPIKAKLELVDGGETVIYTADNSYDHLFKTFINLMLPALRIKAKYADRYRIAWTHNIGINISKLAELKANDLLLNSFDSVGHDILSQYGYLVKPGFKKHHLISIGSVPRLEQWTTFLPAHQLNVLQPFFYAKANHLALPLLGSSLTQFRHVYKLRRKILDLLRMQKYNEKSNTWLDIRPNHQIIDGIKDKDATLKLPELWGRYSKFTDEEREWYKECDDGIIHEYYYDELVICDDKNKKTYGDTAEIPLKSPTPVKAIFWVSENLSATRYNNYSNYTSNAENINQGWNPSKIFKLGYATSTRVEEMSIDHAEREEAWEFPRAPWEPGYNAITFCNNPFSIDGEASVDLQGNNAHLIVTLGNTDPNLINPEDYESKDDFGVVLNNDEEDEEGRITETDTNSKNLRMISPEFIVRCRLLVYRKLSYHYEHNKGYIFQTNLLDDNQVWFDDEIRKK